MKEKKKEKGEEKNKKKESEKRKKLEENKIYYCSFHIACYAEI